MLRWFFYIFCLLYILCNLYVRTRRIRNVCVCNYFLYIRLFFKKLYEYANANAARAAFAICLLFFVSFLAFTFLFEFLPIVFYSHLFFFALFLRSTCKFRERSAKNNVHCFMWPTVCIPNVSYQIFNAWNIKQTKFFTKKS